MGFWNVIKPGKHQRKWIVLRSLRRRCERSSYNTIKQASWRINVKSMIQLKRYRRSANAPSVQLVKYLDDMPKTAQTVFEEVCSSSHLAYFVCANDSNE